MRALISGRHLLEGGTYSDICLMVRRYRKIRDLSLPLLAVLRTSATSPIPWGHGFAQNRVNCIFPSTNQSRLIAINSFVPNASFLHLLKTSENRKVFWYFQGVEEGCIENEWVKQFNDLNWSWNCKRTRTKVPWVIIPWFIPIKGS